MSWLLFQQVGNELDGSQTESNQWRLMLSSECLEAHRQFVLNISA